MTEPRAAVQAMAAGGESLPSGTERSAADLTRLIDQESIHNGARELMRLAKDAGRTLEWEDACDQAREYLYRIAG